MMVRIYSSPSFSKMSSFLKLLVIKLSAKVPKPRNFVTLLELANKIKEFSVFVLQQFLSTLRAVLTILEASLS
jgi:hypothetical protein